VGGTNRTAWHKGANLHQTHKLVFMQVEACCSGCTTLDHGWCTPQG